MKYNIGPFQTKKYLIEYANDRDLNRSVGGAVHQRLVRSHYGFYLSFQIVMRRLIWV